jgi:hypothetical protein
MRELNIVAAGVARVEHRREGRQHLTNCYHVRTTSLHPQRAGRMVAADLRPPCADVEDGRLRAATPGRNGAAAVTADLRPNPETSTDTPPPPLPIAAPTAV